MFEYQLAERLSMTVGELRSRMSQKEFVGWQHYTRHANRLQEEAMKKATEGK